MSSVARLPGFRSSWGATRTKRKRGGGGQQQTRRGKSNANSPLFSRPIPSLWPSVTSRLQSSMSVVHEVLRSRERGRREELQKRSSGRKSKREMCALRFFEHERLDAGRVDHFLLLRLTLLVEVATRFRSLPLPFRLLSRKKPTEPRAHIERFARNNADAWRHQGLFGSAAFTAAGNFIARLCRHRRRFLLLSCCLSSPLCRRRARCPREFPFVILLPSIADCEIRALFADISLSKISVG